MEFYIVVIQVEYPLKIQWDVSSFIIKAFILLTSPALFSRPTFYQIIHQGQCLMLSPLNNTHK
jgi:hypothetical protein